MSEDIRKMIDKVKNFKQFVNENYLPSDAIGYGKSLHFLMTNRHI